MIRTYHTISDSQLTQSVIPFMRAKMDQRTVLQFDVNSDVKDISSLLSTNIMGELILWEVQSLSKENVELKAILDPVFIIRDWTQDMWSQAKAAVWNGNTKSSLDALVRLNPLVQIPQFGETRKMITVTGSETGDKVLDYASFTAKVHLIIKGILVDKQGRQNKSESNLIKEKVINIIPTRIILKVAGDITEGPSTGTREDERVFLTPVKTVPSFKIDKDIVFNHGTSNTIMGASASGKTTLLGEIMDQFNSENVGKTLRRKVIMKTIAIVADEPIISTVLMPYKADMILSLRNLNQFKIEELFVYLKYLSILERKYLNKEDHVIALNIVIDSISEILYTPSDDDRKGTTFSKGLKSEVRGLLLRISNMSGYDQENDILVTGISTVNIPSGGDVRDEANWVNYVSGAEVSYIYLFQKNVYSWRNRVLDASGGVDLDIYRDQSAPSMQELDSLTGKKVTRNRQYRQSLQNLNQIDNFVHQIKTSKE